MDVMTEVDRNKLRDELRNSKPIVGIEVVPTVAEPSSEPIPPVPVAPVMPVVSTKG